MNLYSPDQAIIDRIYEAAVIPERWSDICDILAVQSGSHSAAVIAIGDGGEVNWTASEGSIDLIRTIAQSDLGMSDIRLKRHIERAPFAFLPDNALMSEGELAADAIYNTFLRPAGLGHTAGDVIQEPSGHTIIFDVIRQTDNGPFTSDNIDRLNSHRPDLARAALMSSRLAFRQAQNTVEILSALSLPGAVVTSRGQVKAMNLEMEALSPRIRAGARDRIHVSNAGVQTMIEDRLSQLATGGRPFTQSIALPPQDGAPAMIIHLLPVKRDAHDIFSHAAAIIVASPIGSSGQPDHHVVRGLFDLTATEARIAVAIASGMTVEAIAQTFGNSRETVRSHLKRVFLKTGVKSQAQLVALLWKEPGK